MATTKRIELILEPLVIDVPEDATDQEIDEAIREATTEQNIDWKRWQYVDAWRN